jgi:cell division protein FtsW (lipid II flippase)
MRVTIYVLILWLSLAGLGAFAADVIRIEASSQHLIAVPRLASSASDPNRAPSEFNHHMAGLALIVAGLLVFASYLSPDLRALRYVWPALFLLAGLFLAIWSDAEIWPRGNLSWVWLLHHDQEARQHKIYALLLVTLGLVEYLRSRTSLNRFCRAWAFPMLAVVGAAFLLVHDHTAGSGAISPEARAYLVNPALDPDGNPFAPLASDSIPVSGNSMMDTGNSGMHHEFMPMGDDLTPTDTPSTAPHHHMTPSMLLVEREHFWFMILGVTVALFKLVSDAEFWRRRFVPYVWPCGMVLLGISLVLYRE